MGFRKKLSHGRELVRGFTESCLAKQRKGKDDKLSREIEDWGSVRCAGDKLAPGFTLCKMGTSERFKLEREMT